MDVGIIRLAVLILGVIGVLCVAGIVALPALGHEPPAALAMCATACISTITGILINPGRGPPPPAGH